jgi:hypothetical protein
MPDPAALSDDDLAALSFAVDRDLDTLVDDEDSPLWDQRAAIAAEVAARGL